MIICENKNQCDCLTNMDIEATVDNNIGNPNVTVTKNDNKVVFAFSGLKGATGQPGNNGSNGAQGNPGLDGKTGATPKLGASAHVGQTIGEPNVEVTVSGTDEEPVFNFTFNGIRGNDGHDGRDGVDGVDGRDGKDGKTPSITNEMINDIKDRVLREVGDIDQQITDKIDDIIDDADFWQDKLPEGIISGDSNFGLDDVEEYLQQIGVWTTDGSGNRITSWSKIQLDVNSIQAEVLLLKAGQSVGGQIDYEALSGALYNYITGNTVTSGIQATWAHFLGLSDDTLTTLEWMATGVKSSAGGDANNQTAVTELFAAARNYKNNKEYYDQAWAGVNAIVEQDPNNQGSYIAKGELVTLINNAAGQAVSNAGFATQSDVNSAVASMFAEGGAGKSYIETYVDNKMSSATISADEINLNGDLNIVDEEHDLQSTVNAQYFVNLNNALSGALLRITSLEDTVTRLGARISELENPSEPENP